jgi:hypothetical protein
MPSKKKLNIDMGDCNAPADVKGFSCHLGLRIWAEASAHGEDLLVDDSSVGWATELVAERVP